MIVYGQSISLKSIYVDKKVKQLFLQMLFPFKKVKKWLFYPKFILYYVNPRTRRIRNQTKRIIELNEN